MGSVPQIGQQLHRTAQTVMSFEIYPPLEKHRQVLKHKKVYESEIRWLVEEIIKPELPSLKETLVQCHELLTSDQEIKLPLSSYQSEYIKGVITRKSFKIVNAEIVFKHVKSLNHGRTYRLRLQDRDDIAIRQLIDCDEFISKSLKQIDEIMLIDDYSDHVKLVDDLHNLLISISTSLNYLKTPNPRFLFPMQRTLSTKFQPQLPDTISLEFFVNENDLFLEFHELQHVQLRPWCLVNQETGRSFVDELKLRISKERRKSINTIITEEQEKVMNSDSSTLSGGSDHSFTNSLASLFYNQAYKKQENLRFIESCITYEDNSHAKCVVMVKKNLEINTGDPLLMSMATKLGSVENNIMRFYENLITVLE